LIIGTTRLLVVGVKRGRVTATREWLCCYSSRNGWRIFTRTRLYPYISEQLNYWALQADNHDGLHVL